MEFSQGAVQEAGTDVEGHRGEISVGRWSRRAGGECPLLHFSPSLDAPGGYHQRSDV